MVKKALKSIQAPPLLETVQRQKRQNEREVAQLLAQSETSMLDHAVIGVRDAVLQEVLNEVSLTM